MQILLLSNGVGAIGRYLGAGASIGFIPTAAEPYNNSDFIAEDRERLRRLGYTTIDIDVSGETQAMLRDSIAGVDALFVAGGNTFYLLQQIRDKQVDRMIARHVAAGKLYIGSSAGSVIAGPSIEPVSVFDDPGAAPDLRSYEGLGLVDYVVLPHYGKPGERATYADIERSYAGQFDFVTLRDSEAIFARSPSDRAIIESAIILQPLASAAE